MRRPLQPMAVAPGDERAGQRPMARIAEAMTLCPSRWASISGQVSCLPATASREFSRASIACRLLQSQGLQVLAGLLQGDHPAPPVAASSCTSSGRCSTWPAGVCTANAALRGPSPPRESLSR